MLRTNKNMWYKSQELVQTQIFFETLLEPSFSRTVAPFWVMFGGKLFYLNLSKISLEEGVINNPYRKSTVEGSLGNHRQVGPSSWGSIRAERIS